LSFEPMLNYTIYCTNWYGYEYKFDLDDWSHYNDRRKRIVYGKDIFENPVYVFSHEVLHRVLHIEVNLTASRRLDDIRYGYEEMDTTRERMCNEVNECEIVSGIDCLACDVYWRYKFGR